MVPTSFEPSSLPTLAGRPDRRERAFELLSREDGRVRIKLCGMHRAEDVAAASAVSPDLCGFVCLFPKSHRDVRPEELPALVSRVAGHVLTTMVIVDQPPELAAGVANVAGIDVIQLHGHEDAAYVQALRASFDGPVIQAFRIREAADVDEALASPADMVLLDAGQGSGETFDWSLVEGFRARRPYLLAGGLTPENVVEAISALGPWGVDMSSGIETSGRKDPQKMAAAVAAVRSAQ